MLGRFEPTVNAVACAVGVAPSSILGSSRAEPIATARAMVCWILRQPRPVAWSLHMIGSRVGRHHATVLHSIRRVHWDAEIRQLAESVAEEVDARRSLESL